MLLTDDSVPGLAEKLISYILNDTISESRSHKEFSDHSVTTLKKIQQRTRSEILVPALDSDGFVFTLIGYDMIGMFVTR